MLLQEEEFAGVAAEEGLDPEEAAAVFAIAEEELVLGSAAEEEELQVFPVVVKYIPEEAVAAIAVE